MFLIKQFTISFFLPLTRSISSFTSTWTKQLGFDDFIDEVEDINRVHKAQAKVSIFSCTHLFNDVLLLQQCDG
jgi:hypothetical protein